MNLVSANLPACSFGHSRQGHAVLSPSWTWVVALWGTIRFTRTRSTSELDSQALTFEISAICMESVAIEEQGRRMAYGML